MNYAIDLGIEIPKMIFGDIPKGGLKYTDSKGNVSDTKTTTCYFGPYIRKIPPLPVGAKKGNTGIAAADGDGVGWIYDASAGNITANTSAGELDDAGKKYSDY